MKFFRLLKIELLKQKKGVLWFVTFIIPLGTTVGIFLDIYLRGYNDFLKIAERKNFSIWKTIMLENHFNLGWGRFIPIFVGVLSVMIYYIEFKEDSWKNLISLPIKKAIIYSSKFFSILIFSWFLIILNVLGLFIVGKLIGFTEPIDYLLYGKYILYQCGAIIGVVALQNWLSSYFKNALLPIFIGLGGMLTSAVAINQSPTLGIYFPYIYPFLAVPHLTKGFEELGPLVAVYASFISGIIISLLGYLEFRYRNIL